MMAADLFAVLDGDASQASPIFYVEMPGTPRGKGRPRGMIAYTRERKPYIHFYTDKDTAQYENALRQLAKIKMGARLPYDGPLALRLFAMMPIPKSWSARERAAALVGTKFPTVKPDHDNIEKLCCDALNKVVWNDDVQVVRSLMVKEYAGSTPGLIIEVYRLP